MIRRVAIAGIIAAGLLAPLPAAAPASAGSDLGCAGNGCSILLSKLITLNGDVGTGAGFVPISLAPPPCLWEPIGNAVSGSNYVLQQFPNPTPDTPFGVPASARQAKKLLATRPVPGGHVVHAADQPGGRAGEQACLRLPLFFFAVPGQALPAVPVPPRTLAEFAYNHMLIPRPALTLNPAAGGYVNLGTYVWGNWAASPTTGRMNAYKITATLGGQTVTVWAQASGFAVNVTGPGTPYSAGCGPAGSRYPRGQAPAAPGRASRRTAGCSGGRPAPAPR